MKKVIILSGPPGCGKSSWRRKKHPEAVACSADHFFTDDDGSYHFDPTKLGEAHASCMHEFIDLVFTGTKIIVVDNTNIHKWERDNYVLLAEKMGYEVEIRFWYSDSISQIRSWAKRNEHKVPLDVCLRMAAEHEVEYGSGRCFEK